MAQICAHTVSNAAPRERADQKGGKTGQWQVFHRAQAWLRNLRIRLLRTRYTHRPIRGRENAEDRAQVSHDECMHFPRLANEFSSPQNTKFSPGLEKTDADEIPRKHTDF
jgi:hypothetical protein